MAESDKAKSLSEDYLLKDTKEKKNVDTVPGEQAVEKDDVNAAPEEPVTAAVGETVSASVDSSRGSDAAAEENVTVPPPAATKESSENSDTDITEPPPAATEESSENVDEGNTAEEQVEIKLETAPGDYRFPTTNQSRHCFTRYVEYHRCVAAKGEDASECDKFAKYYRSLCPGEWIDRWNEQRENGTFPGPL